MRKTAFYPGFLTRVGGLKDKVDDKSDNTDFYRIRDGEGVVRHSLFPNFSKCKIAQSSSELKIYSYSPSRFQRYLTF